jgi:hypothetical protein
MLDDGQAQTGATGLARSAAVDPVKALGQTGQVLGRNARAGICFVSPGRSSAGTKPETDIAGDSGSRGYPP